MIQGISIKMKSIGLLFMYSLFFLSAPSAVVGQEIVDDISEIKVYKRVSKALKTRRSQFGLNLRDRFDGTLPHKLFRVSDVTYLNLSGNKIKELPLEIFAFKKLQILVLSDNELTTIPKEIDKLESLRHLHLSSNNLRELPSSIENLIHLDFLVLVESGLSKEYIRELRKRMPNCTIVEYWIK